MPNFTRGFVWWLRVWPYLLISAPAIVYAIVTVILVTCGGLE